jgi:large subunit ribosomal protein L9
MKVIYLRNVKGEAKKDDIKEVSDGYALNKLIPQGIAIRATDDAIKQIKQGQALSAEAEMKKDAEIKQLIALISKTGSVTLSGHAHDGKGHLYQAVTAQEICHALKASYDIFITKDMVLDYTKPIKTTGDHVIKIGNKKYSTEYKVIIK